MANNRPYGKLTRHKSAWAAAFRFGLHVGVFGAVVLAISRNCSITVSSAFGTMTLDFRALILYVSLITSSLFSVSSKFVKQLQCD
jgi:hypothetical protein